jgi:hypothetical protein
VLTFSIPAIRGHEVNTDWGAWEFATLDVDGNPLMAHRIVEMLASGETHSPAGFTIT